MKENYVVAENLLDGGFRKKKKLKSYFKLIKYTKYMTFDDFF